MKTVYEMLLDCKTGYFIYIGRKSFNGLMLFIDGYEKCISELFGGEEKSVINSIDFRRYVEEYFRCNKPNHNWKEILLFESHTDENAFDVFYDVLDSYLKDNPTVAQEEMSRQEKYRVFQLDRNFQQVPKSDSYFTSATVPEWLESDFPDDISSENSTTDEE